MRWLLDPWSRPGYEWHVARRLFFNKNGVPFAEFGCGKMRELRHSSRLEERPNSSAPTCVACVAAYSSELAMQTLLEERVL